MKRIIKNVTKGFMVLTVAFSAVLGMGAVSGGVAYAAVDDCAAEEHNTDVMSDPGTCTEDINKRIYGLAKVVAGIVLGFAVLMIVYAGFKYTTSQGDPKVTEQAKMQIVTSGIGIGVAMLAFVIVGIFENVMK